VQVFTVDLVTQLFVLWRHAVWHQTDVKVDQAGEVCVVLSETLS
jgi:hypothetical protein